MVIWYFSFFSVLYSVPKSTVSDDSKIERFFNFVFGVIFGAEYQVKLLRACKYGKLFIKNQELFDCDTFVETCRFLRVLNSIRNIKIGMPLTFIQFETVTPEVVVQRLINRKKHLLAIKISKYLGLSFCVNQALEHWSICKIESTPRNVTDAKLVDMIRRKILKFSTDFSYAKIARCAQKRSTDLAKLLLDYEPRSKVQINALIEFEQFIVALKKALVSLDIDLINQVILFLLFFEVYNFEEVQ